MEITVHDGVLVSDPKLVIRLIIQSGENRSIKLNKLESSPLMDAIMNGQTIANPGGGPIKPPGPIGVNIKAKGPG